MSQLSITVYRKQRMAIEKLFKPSKINPRPIQICYIDIEQKTITEKTLEKGLVDNLMDVLNCNDPDLVEVKPFWGDLYLASKTNARYKEIRQNGFIKVQARGTDLAIREITVNSSAVVFTLHPQGALLSARLPVEELKKYVYFVPYEQAGNYSPYPDQTAAVIETKRLKAAEGHKAELAALQEAASVYYIDVVNQRIEVRTAESREVSALKELLECKQLIIDGTQLDDLKIAIDGEAQSNPKGSFLITKKLSKKHVVKELSEDKSVKQKKYTLKLLERVPALNNAVIFRLDSHGKISPKNIRLEKLEKLLTFQSVEAYFKEPQATMVCLNKNKQHLSALNIPKEVWHTAYFDNIARWLEPQLMQQQTDKVGKSEGILRVRTANRSLSDAQVKPIPKMLFSELWHEGEICILFADANAGKSILAVQIADAISRGKPIEGFTLEAPRQSVLYLDFELSDKQFQNRYSLHYEHPYEFVNNFLRCDVVPDFAQYTEFETQLFASLERLIREHRYRVVIVDNITFLKAHSTETARDAMSLMRKLNQLKRTHDLSMLLLAHTPKRNPSKPLTMNELSGSKQLANFADSMFGIATSCKDQHLRYLKQIKARATEKLYDSDNVIVCRVDKPHNFLEFQFVGYAEEAEHLKRLTGDEKAELENKIIAVRREQPSLSYREIANKLHTNHMKVKRVLDAAGL